MKTTPIDGTAGGPEHGGKIEPYDHLPFFYSDMFELGYEAVGEVDSRLETFADWKRPNEEGVVYYLKDGRVRGVLLWNVWEQVEAARKLIAAPGPFNPENLKGRLAGMKSDIAESAITNSYEQDTNLNQLEQIKKMTTVVADTADFESIREFQAAGCDH